MITELKAAGHQVYVSLYAGVSQLNEESGGPQQLRDFEDGVMSCMTLGGANALVDGGLGFWTEHNKLWDEGEWFRISSQTNEVALSRVLDRSIMRQKT